MPQDSIMGVPIREPTESEIQFFRSRPDVPGYAAPDNSVVVSPFHKLDPDQLRGLMLNEATRVFMRVNKITPNFALTPEQKKQFSTYGSIEDQRATITARAIAGDESVGKMTTEQMLFVKNLKKKLPKE